jgi:hypothetical protein
MATKNILAKEARTIVKTMDHRPPASPPFRPTKEDFPLPDEEHSNPISAEITQASLENPKRTPTTLNNGSW